MRSAIPIPLSSPRRHHDPPILWQAVLIGSLLLHLAALFTLRRFQVEIVATQPASAPVPVEMIDLSAAAGTDPTAQATTLTAPNPTPTTPQPAVTNPTSPPAPAERAIAPPPQAKPSPRPVEPAATPKPPVAPRATPPSKPPTAPPKTPDSPAALPPNPPPLNAGGGATPLKPAPTQSGEKIPGVPGGTTPSQPKGPDINPPDKSEEPSSGVTVPRNPGQSNGIIAALGEVRPADSKVVQEILPKPKRRNITLPFLSIPIDMRAVEGASGKRITVRVIINKAGKPEPSPIWITSSSGFPQVDNMAKEAIKEFEFEPAHASAATLDTPVDALIEIEIQITPAP